MFRKSLFFCSSSVQMLCSISGFWLLCLPYIYDAHHQPFLVSTMPCFTYGSHKPYRQIYKYTLQIFRKKRRWKIFRMQNGINARPIHGWNLFIGERVIWMAFLLLVPCCCFHINAHLCSALLLLLRSKNGFRFFFSFFYLLRRHHACPWRYTGTHVNYHNLNFVNWTCFLWVYCIFVATSAIIFRFEFVSSSVQKQRFNRKSMRDREKKSDMHKK